MYAFYVWTQATTLVHTFAPGSEFCWYDGVSGLNGFSSLEISSSVLTTLNPVSDFWDRYVHDPVKPFHFGILVINRHNPDNITSQFYAWSYLNGDFWNSATENNGPHEFIYFDPMMCLITLPSAR